MMQTSLYAPLQQEFNHLTELSQRKTVEAESQQIDFEDQRPVAVTQRQISALINSSPRVLQQKFAADAIGAKSAAQRQKIEASFDDTVQRQEIDAMEDDLNSDPRDEEKTLQRKFEGAATVQLLTRQSNKEH